MDEQACFERIVAALRRDGLVCPNCGGSRHGVHRKHRVPVLDYRCRDCRRVINAYTGTVLQDHARAGLCAQPPPDRVVEADECYVNAGKKGGRHDEPDDPPRCRANKRRGHGTFDNDRPPVVAAAGRETGRACFEVVEHSDRRTLEGLAQATTVADARLNADEWRAYQRLPELGRGHVTLNHGEKEWARD